MTYLTASVVAVVLVTVAFIVVVRRPDSADSIDQLIGRLRPVNLELFRNVTSLETDRFLRERLRWTDLVRARRARARAALDYLYRMFGNAGVLIRIGDLGRTSELSEAATSLANQAVRARLKTAIEISRWTLAYLIPTFSPVGGGAIDDYAELRTRLSSYSLFWQPAQASRLAASM
jgi:hypothetical protein